MSKRQLLMILGIWVIIFLFLGFPSNWGKALAIITGLIIIGISYQMRPPAVAEKGEDMPYVEHKIEKADITIVTPPDTK